MSDNKPLKKLRFEKETISGVCSGIAYAAGMNVLFVRFLWVISIFVFTSAAPIIVYLLVAIILPEWNALPEDYEERAERSF